MIYEEKVKKILRKFQPAFHGFAKKIETRLEKWFSNENTVYA